jgi:methylglyoxal synthase
MERIAVITTATTVPAAQREPELHVQQLVSGPPGWSR